MSGRADAGRTGAFPLRLAGWTRKRRERNLGVKVTGQTRPRRERSTVGRVVPQHMNKTNPAHPRPPKYNETSETVLLAPGSGNCAWGPELTLTVQASPRGALAVTAKQLKQEMTQLQILTTVAENSVTGEKRNPCVTSGQNAAHVHCR